MQVVTRMNVGGPALLVCALMRGLDAGRYEQRLCTGDLAPGEADFVAYRAPDVRPVTIPGLGRTVRPADDLRALRALVAEMRRFRPHIVHTHTAKAGVLGRLAAVAARVPARVHTFHGHLLHGYFSPAATRLVAAAERLLAKPTDRLVAVGARVRDDLLAAGIGRPDQYVVVPPGTSLDRLPERRAARRALGLDGDGPVVAYVGRLTGIKRPDRLVRVAREVRQVVPDVRFVVCGGGDALDEVLPATRSRDGATVVRNGPFHYVGWRSDVETVYAAADLVLLTSDNEGMPLTLIEAGLAGVPAVATRVGSVAEIVRDGVTGALAACRDDELARHTVRLLRDEELRRAMGRRAREWTAARFSTARLVSDMQDAYGRIAEQRGWPIASLQEKCPM